MTFPLRPATIVAAGFLCLSICDFTAQGQQIRSLSSLRGTTPEAAAAAMPAETVVIAGPLRPFLRMAGISQEIAPEEVLPLLARNVALRGFEGGGQTEFLVLLNRYVQFAREVQQLADAQGMIHAANCAEAARLIQALGYRFEETCGDKKAYLITANPERAFLTIDSGFPLTELEQALQKHTVFSYGFPSTRVPVLFREKDWMALSSGKTRQGNLVDVLLHEQDIDRLYWALSKQDEETQTALRRSPGLKRLLPMAAALDFYGSQLCIHSGRVELPGGADAERGWEDLVGASRKSPAEFVDHLFTKDRGWLAAYFDTLSRVPPAEQAHLTQGARLKRVYDVYRTAGGGTAATMGVFPRNGSLLILFSRMQWQGDGQPYLPGTLAIWREIFLEDSSPSLVRGWVKRAKSWDSPEQVLLSLAACASFDTEAGPAQVYLTLSAIEEARGANRRLSDATVRLLAEQFARFHSWYPIFTEFPALDDTSITMFVHAGGTLNGIPSPTLRSNALGAFQANVGLWQILARQQEIPSDKMNSSWQGMVQPFAAIPSSVELFDATHKSLKSIFIAATGNGNLSQDQIIDALAGPTQQSEAGRRVHEVLADRIRTVLDDQRLVSLDTLFALYGGLDEMAHGSAKGDGLIALAGSLREFEMPRPIFSEREKVAWAPEIYSSRHAELQVRTDLTRVLRGPGSPAQLEAARGQLTPFLRDTLVGLNYAYYEPPGAQVLHHNPLFVRSHDFSANSILGYNKTWDSPELIGIGLTAGGGAYLIGSLADLPYALATTEEDFIAPENVQALIWSTAVPALLVSSIQPRWWDVSPRELHAAALYQQMGEDLLTEAAADAQLRSRVLEVLSDTMSPKRLERTGDALTSGHLAGLADRVTPAEKFYLSTQYRKRFPDDGKAGGAAAQELQALAGQNASDVSPERLSRDFGVPHPALAQTEGCAILNVKPLPAFGGGSYRLLGESWESTNLYWARLADQMGYSPVMLNVMIPELSRRMVAKIFATDIEDWPALLRAMEETGKEFQDGRIRIAAAETGLQNSGQHGMGLN